MSSSLHGKTVLITGAGQGIGLALATAFARAGARLAITGRDAAKLERAAGPLREHGAEVLVLPGDVRERSVAGENVARTLERYRQLDVLVNNAQASTPGIPLEAIDDAAVALTLESGLLGTLYHMQAAFPHFRERGKGAILNFGSRRGITGEPGFGIYAATKEGVRGLSRAAAREWGPYGIRVNVMCPAALTEAAHDYLEKNPAHKTFLESNVPLRRLGDPIADICPVALFLVSDEARYVTGQTIHVDGGLTMF